MKILLLEEKEWDYDELVAEEITLFSAPDGFEFTVDVLEEFINTLEGYEFKSKKYSFSITRPAEMVFKFANRVADYSYPAALLEKLNPQPERELLIKWLAEEKDVHVVEYSYI